VIEPDAGSAERCLMKGKLDVKKLNPLLLTMPDNR
jgi:hypothetical protein